MTEFRDIESYLAEIEDLPNTEWDEFISTLTFDDAFEFLKDSVEGELPIYISTSGFFLYGLFVPENLLEKDYADELLNWSDLPPSGWGHVESYSGEETRHWAEPPMERYQGILREADPTLYLDEFYGHETELRLNKKLYDLLWLRWFDRKDAYCRLDQNGDYDPIVRVWDEEKVICTLKREAFDYYASLTNMVLVRFFDFTRFKNPSHNLSAPNSERDQVNKREEEIFAKRGLKLSEDSERLGGWLRGFQIIRTDKEVEKAKDIYEGVENEEYAEFIAHDWKNSRVDEISCAPEALASYFDEDSDLPFETTPAFFSPEVLSKYKQDTEKYTIEHRKIRCRGAWSIDFDINAEGQVHAYLCDLQRLPYDEQIYWKSFNEEPEGGISERAYKTDFLGVWDESYDPLLSLERTTNEFPKIEINGEEFQIWLDDEAIKERIHYVTSDRTKDWEDQVDYLSQWIVEGLDKQEIRKLAQKSDCDNPQLGSISLLEECLNSIGLQQEIMEEIISPLKLVWHFRSKYSDHRGKNVKEDIDQDLREHFAELLAECDYAMETLAELIESGIFENDPS